MLKIIRGLPYFMDDGGKLHPVTDTTKYDGDYTPQPEGDACQSNTCAYNHLAASNEPCASCADCSEWVESTPPPETVDTCEWKPESHKEPGTFVVGCCGIEKTFYLLPPFEHCPYCGRLIKVAQQKEV